MTQKHIWKCFFAKVYTPKKVGFYLFSMQFAGWEKPAISLITNVWPPQSQGGKFKHNIALCIPKLNSTFQVCVSLSKVFSLKLTFSFFIISRFFFNNHKNLNDF